MGGRRRRQQQQQQPTLEHMDVSILRQIFLSTRLSDTLLKIPAKNSWYSRCFFRFYPGSAFAAGFQAFEYSVAQKTTRKFSIEKCEYAFAIFVLILNSPLEAVHVHAKKKCEHKCFLFGFLAFSIYLLCALHDCKGLVVVRCCARVYKTTHLPAPISPPPTQTQTKPSLTPPSLVHFTSIVPQTFYELESCFGKKIPVIGN